MSLAEADATTQEALQALHPPEEPPRAPEFEEPPAIVSVEALRMVLARLPKGSAAGPSGTTYEHIRAAALDRETVFTLVLRLVNAIVAGSLPYIPHLLDSHLVAFNKPGGGVRPIAIGETWLRLASLCAVQASAMDGSDLAPLQLAVGVSGGAQCVAMALDAGRKADPECVTLKVDFKNAFNAVSRASVLQAVADRCPDLLPFAWWQYRQHARLVQRTMPPGAAAIDSQCGVRQGGPDSVLLFCLALQPALEAAQDARDDVRIVAYADDVYLQGTIDDVCAAFKELRDRTQEIGLEVRMDKCCVNGCNPDAGRAAAARLLVRHAEDGFMAAGTPLGTEAYVKKHASDAAAKTAALATTLTSTPLSVQEHMLLLRMSLRARMAHLARTVPWQELHEATAWVEDRLERHAMDYLGLDNDEVNALGVRAQVRLALRFGGFGMTKLTELGALAAQLAAAALTEAAMVDGAEKLRPISGAQRAHYQEAWHRVHAAAGDVWTAEQKELTAAVVTSVLPSAQKKYGLHEAQRDYEALLAQFDDSAAGLRARARLLSVACRQAVIWQDALPTTPSLTMDCSVYQTAAKNQLGLAPAAMPVVTEAGRLHPTCPFCNKDALQDHAMSCSHVSAARTWRHDNLVSCWRRVAQRACITTSKEPELHQIRTDKQTSRERGDVCAIMANDTVIADISVIHPYCKSVMEKTDPATTVGAAARLRDEQKRDKYNKVALAKGYTFMPISHESSGRLGRPAMAWLKAMAEQAVKKAAISTSVTKAAFVSNALKELSVAMCKGNEGMYNAWRAVEATPGKAIVWGNRHSSAEPS